MAIVGRSVLLLALIAGVSMTAVGPAAGLAGTALLAMLLWRCDGASVRVRSLSREELSFFGCDAELAGGVQVLEAEGPLLFTSAPRIDGLLPDRPPWPSDLVFDLRRVTHMDESALRALLHVIDCLELRSGSFALLCQPRSRLLWLLQRRGLAARALGGTCCFTLAHAIDRIATRHQQTRPASGKRTALGSLRLLRLPADRVG